MENNYFILSEQLVNKITSLIGGATFPNTPFAEPYSTLKMLQEQLTQQDALKKQLLSEDKLSKKT